MSDEFFVGYLPMPRATARRMKRMAGAIVVLGAATATALAIATGRSIARRTSMDTSGVAGALESAPVPVLVAEDGHAFPLVAQGKHGAAPSIAGNEGRAVRLEGRRIVRDGRP